MVDLGVQGDWAREREEYLKDSEEKRENYLREYYLKGEKEGIEKGEGNDIGMDREVAWDHMEQKWVAVVKGTGMDIALDTAGDKDKGVGDVKEGVGGGFVVRGDEEEWKVLKW